MNTYASLQKNFDYLERLDRQREQCEMTSEDKPSHQVTEDEDDKVVSIEKSISIFLKMAGGIPIADEDGLRGLGSKKTGIREPIILKTQRHKNGLGFIYRRYFQYPNRRYNPILWIRQKK